MVQSGEVTVAADDISYRSTKLDGKVEVRLQHLGFNGGYTVF